MTGTDPERLERRLRWAAEQLGLSPDASLEEVRAAWLRRLPAEEFVPCSELRWALAALLRRPSEGGWEARADEAASVVEEDRLRGEVETFAEQFWDFPAEERRRRWEELNERCAFAPSLRARLRMLEAGLENVPTPNEGEGKNRTIELAGHLRELFVLRPRARTCARHALLLRMEADKEHWKHAARRLRRAYPKFAALGNDLLDKILTAMPMPKSLPKKPPPQLTAAKSGEKSPARYLWVLVGIVVGLFRVACNDKPSSPPTTKPAYQWDLKYPLKTDGKKLSPEALELLTKGLPIQNEEVKEKARKLLEQMEKNRKQEKKRKNDKTGGKYP